MTSTQSNRRRRYIKRLKALHWERVDRLMKEFRRTCPVIYRIVTGRRKPAEVRDSTWFYIE